MTEVKASWQLYDWSALQATEHWLDAPSGTSEELEKRKEMFKTINMEPGKRCLNEQSQYQGN